MEVNLVQLDIYHVLLWSAKLILWDITTEFLYVISTEILFVLTRVDLVEYVLCKHLL